MYTEYQKQVLTNAWNTFGENNQLDMLMEECAELIQAVNKLKRAKRNQRMGAEVLQLMGEIVDVKNMIQQVESGMGLRLENIQSEKIDRLHHRILEYRQTEVDRANSLEQLQHIGRKYGYNASWAKYAWEAKQKNSTNHLENSK